MRYYAAAIPRFIRIARLSYLPLGAVIGSQPSGLVHDVIMLPEHEFQRARQYLGAAALGASELRRGAFSPVFVPQDIRFFDVEDGSLAAQERARNHFRLAFGLIAPDVAAQKAG